MEKNRDVGKILLKINSQYYEKGMKNISIQLKGVRKGKIAEMDRKVIIPQIIRSKEYNIFEKIQCLRKEKESLFGGCIKH